MDNPEITEEIAQYIQKRFGNKRQNILIAVTGNGCSGKTTFCRGLMRFLPDSGIFFLDGYYTDINERRRKGLTGSHPDSLRAGLLVEDLNRIKRGIDFDKPVSEVSPEDNIKHYEPAKYNIIDGLPALLVPDTEIYDFVIFIECDDEVQIERRIGRDTAQRKRPESEIRPILNKRNEQFRRFIIPKRSKSDIILHSGRNFRLSYHPEQTC
ncbi:MAG: AAA family ATPase [Candidatus Woesearchaeota archaeon]